MTVDLSCLTGTKASHNKASTAVEIRYSLARTGSPGGDNGPASSRALGFLLARAFLSSSKETGLLLPCQTFARPCPQLVGEASTALECFVRERLLPVCGHWRATHLAGTDGGAAPMKGAKGVPLVRGIKVQGCQCSPNNHNVEGAPLFASSLPPSGPPWRRVYPSHSLSPLHWDPRSTLCSRPLLRSSLRHVRQDSHARTESGLIKEDGDLFTKYFH